MHDIRVQQAHPGSGAHRFWAQAHQEVNQDCYRAGDVHVHRSFSNLVGALYEALSRAQIRKSDIDLVATIAKAADPAGKFYDETRK